MSLVHTIAGVMFAGGSVAGYDPDAQAFFDAIATAGGSLTTPEKDAVNSLVLGFKANGTWGKKTAIYPLVGGSAQAHKFNLKNPADTDAAYRLTFAGASLPVHAANGLVFNGNGYADTHIFDSLLTSSASMSAWSLIEKQESGAIMGMSSGAVFVSLWPLYVDAKVYGSLMSGYLSAPAPSSIGLAQITRNGDALELYKNGVSINTLTASPTAVKNLSIYLGACNLNGTGTEYESTNTLSYAEVGQFHTSTDAMNDYNTIAAFHTALGR